MTDVHIRRYDPSDFSKVIDIMRLNVPKYFAESEVEDLSYYLCHEIEQYFVAEYKGQIIGAGGINFGQNRPFGQTMKNTQIGKISWDFVHPTFHGRGVGRILLKYRIDLLKAIDEIQDIFVDTSQLTYLFYEKNGFVLLEKHQDYWAQGFDLYRMIYKEA